MVARSLWLDPVIGKYFKYIAGPNKADWAGQGILQGLEFDLTTFKGVEAHVRRYLSRDPDYLKRIIFWTYHL